MSDKYFIDTNILIYAHERSAGEKHKQARSLLEKLWENDSGVISTQIIQEFCVSAIRKSERPVAFAELSATIQDLLKWQVVVNEADSALRALRVQERFDISFWDALVVHAAEFSGAKILYSEDLNDGQVYGNVRVVNPFKA